MHCWAAVTWEEWQVCIPKGMAPAPPEPRPALWLQELDFGQLASQIKATQDRYKAALARNDVEGMKQAMFEVDETQVGG